MTGRCNASPRRSHRHESAAGRSTTALRHRAADDVEIILETEVDALDITVLKGGGDAVGKWALENGFLLSPDAPEVLDYYADRSPVFMAAKFDAERADRLGQGAGDSTPIMATIPTDDPWVPLRILGLGLEGSRNVEADVFLLTDNEPELLAGGYGLSLERSEEASDFLLDELRSDVGMKWVPDEMWLSYLQLDTNAGELDYDLAVSDHPQREPSIDDAGVGPAAVVPVRPPADPSMGWPIAGRAGCRRGGARPGHGDRAPTSGGGGVKLLAILAIAGATGRRGRLRDRRPGDGGAARAARSRHGHRCRRRRAQPFRAVVAARGGGDDGALRGRATTTRSTTS